MTALHPSYVSRHIVALLSIEGIGPSAVRRVLRARDKQYFTWREFWHNTHQLWQQCQLSQAQQANISQFVQLQGADAYWQVLLSKKLSIIANDHPWYPPLLKHIPDPPIYLFAKHTKGLPQLDLPIAVVGARKMTEYGAQATQTITAQLVAEGASIISGGMYGIDIVAHQTALAQGGATVLVLGCGTDHVFPTSMAGVYSQLLQAGAVLVSEHPPETPPKAGFFPRRNRLVAGMSYATVVVEAGPKSGSHITAQCALEYGRVVGAVPGPITSLYSEGTKWLCNQGALMVSSGQDVLSEVMPQHTSGGVPLDHRVSTKQYIPSQTLASSSAPVSSSSIKPPNPSLTPQLHTQRPQAQRVLGYLQGTPASPAEDIAHTLQLPVSQILTELSFLELSGKVLRVGWQWQAV